MGRWFAPNPKAVAVPASMKRSQGGARPRTLQRNQVAQQPKRQEKAQAVRRQEPSLQMPLLQYLRHRDGEPSMSVQKPQSDQAPPSPAAEAVSVAPSSTSSGSEKQFANYATQSTRSGDTLLSSVSSRSQSQVRPRMGAQPQAKPQSVTAQRPGVKKETPTVTSKAQKQKKSKKSTKRRASQGQRRRLRRKQALNQM